MKRAALLLAAFVVAACSSSSSNDAPPLVAPDLDASVPSDAGTQVQKEERGTAPACSLPPALVVSETKRLTATWLTMDADPTRATALVEIEDNSKHLLTFALERMKDIGFFRDGFRTGVFEISGTETRAMTCSVCVGLSTMDANYLAIGGKVHVDAIQSPSSPSDAGATGNPKGRLAVRLENVRFKIVTGLDAQNCESTLASYAFDVELTPDKF